MDEPKKKILVVGANGIGSYFCRALQEGYVNEYKGFEIDEIEVFVMDKDKIEAKNLPYTTYDIEDENLEKSDVIAKKYGLKSKVEWLEKAEQINGFDYIVMAVDNNKVRNIVANSGKEFLDLRATGRNLFAMYVDKENIEEYKKLTKDNGKKGSCQITIDLENKEIQRGNVIVAEIGFQMLLNKLRGKTFGKKWVMII